MNRSRDPRSQIPVSRNGDSTCGPSAAAIVRGATAVPGYPKGNALGLDGSKPGALFELQFNRLDFGHEPAGVAAQERSHDAEEGVTCSEQLGMSHAGRGRTGKRICPDPSRAPRRPVIRPIQLR